MMEPGMSADPWHPLLDGVSVVDVLAALADPVRLEMVRILAAAGGELPCSSIAVPVSKSTSSHHFKVLREAGIVRAREEGTRRFYRLRREEFERQFPGLLDSVLLAARAQAPNTPVSAP
jgi:DNA-binding transcriptional ArsR family regulator